MPRKFNFCRLIYKRMKGCLLNEDLKMLWLTVTSNLDLGSLVGLIVIHLLLSLNPWLIDDI